MSKSKIMVGADDYLTKQFNMRELMARVEAMLRRVRLMHEEIAADGKEDKRAICLRSTRTVSSDMIARLLASSWDTLKLAPHNRNWSTKQLDQIGDRIFFWLGR